MWVDSAERPGKAHRVGRGKWETRAQGDLLIQGVRNGDEGGERPKGREGADGQQPQNSDHIFGIEVITVSSFQINDPKKWNKACPWPNLGWIYYSHFFLQRKLIYLIDLWFFFLHLLWLIKFCLKSKQNLFFWGSLSWVHHERECRTGIRNTKKPSNGPCPHGAWTQLKVPQVLRPSSLH